MQHACHLQHKNAALALVAALHVGQVGVASRLQCVWCNRQSGQGTACNALGVTGQSVKRSLLSITGDLQCMTKLLHHPPLVVVFSAAASKLGSSVR